MRGMCCGIGVGLAVVFSCGIGSAGTYIVTTTADSGTGSLQWAIDQANSHLGPDTVTFKAGLSGKTFFRKTALPALTDDATTINGDLDGNGRPDVLIRGEPYPWPTPGTGFQILGNDCALAGLAVSYFPVAGIHIKEAARCAVRSCYLGLNLAGTTEVANEGDDIFLEDATDCVIGGTHSSLRNVIGAAFIGIHLEGCHHCRIQGNYVGLKADGRTALHRLGGAGIVAGFTLKVSDYITIGGTERGARNVIAGLSGGVNLSCARWCTIAGNYIGLAANGRRAVPVEVYCVFLQVGSERNTIGGTTARARNVFCSASTGIRCYGDTTRDNTILGNYFGLNAAGTEVRPMSTGIRMSSGPHVIGGTVAGSANHFHVLQTDWVTPPRCAVLVEGLRKNLGAGTQVIGNRFGLLPDGTEVVAPDATGVSTDVPISIRGNVFAGFDEGVHTEGARGTPKVLQNAFRRCVKGVAISGGARPLLGNLGNAGSADDGGNVFARTNTWHIYNDTPNTIKAEGNDFRTTSKAAINRKIHDKRDDPALGRVDFVPLLGGVVPSEGLGPRALVLTAACATGTSSGAEIVFTLTAAAEVRVEVLNLAGRPVRELVCADAKAGLNRMHWNCCGATGTRVPNGRYLVRVTARDPNGSQGSAVTALSVSR